MDPYRTRPHGEHEIRLIEDRVKVGNRIYDVRGHSGARLGFTGEEMASLADWWARETFRTGTDEELD